MIWLIISVITAVVIFFIFEGIRFLAIPVAILGGVIFFLGAGWFRNILIIILGIIAVPLLIMWIQELIQGFFLSNIKKKNSLKKKTNPKTAVPESNAKQIVDSKEFYPAPTNTKPPIEAMDKAIQALTDQKQPDISALPAYNEETVTVKQQKGIQNILQWVAQGRKQQMETLQTHLLENSQNAFEKIAKHIAQLESRGLHINADFIRKQRENLESDKTLMRQAEKCYRIDNAKCMEVLKLPSSKKKKNDFRKFENEVLAEGIDMYFEQLSESCETVFASIDDALKKHNAQNTAVLSNLVAKNRKNIFRTLKDAKDQLQNEVKSGKYTG